MFDNKNLNVFLIFLYLSDVLFNISSETFISEDESVEATHNLKISDPNLSIIFCGAMTLPFDLDILFPFASTVKP